MNYKDYVKLTKPTARKLYNLGCTIKLIPCRVSSYVVTRVPSDYDWIVPVEISILNCKYESNKFDRTVNEYQFYNCNAELGYYPHYYVSQEDYNNYLMCNLMCNNVES